MVTRNVVRLMLALALSGTASAAWATGEFIQEVRFFSRSGMDPVDNLACFHGRLGILRPTMDDNRLFAAYRQMMGGTITDTQATAGMLLGMMMFQPLRDVQFGRKAPLTPEEIEKRARDCAALFLNGARPSASRT